MKGALWLLALFLIAVAVTLAARYNSGYVLVVAQPYRIELSLNLLAALLLVIFFIAYFVVRLAVVTFRLPAEVSRFRLHRRREKARMMMLDGLRAFFEGRYAKAEKASAAVLELKEPPSVSALNAMVAARSAHELRKYSRRDELIAMAKTSAPKEITMLLMTQAELLLDEHRPEEALKILHSLPHAGAGKHTAALRLELRAQQRSKNWDAVLDLLGQLDQRNAVDKTVMRQLRLQARMESLKSRMLNPQALSDCVTAHQIIEESLNTQWDSELAGLYAKCPGGDAISQIEHAEAWLESHPNDACLLLALGKLCVNCELWGKAQNYLEASLSVDPDYPAHLALAQLNEKLGRLELARDHYSKGLELALWRLDALEQE